VDYPIFIENAGTCLVTSSVLGREARVQFMVREPSAAPGDTGWRFMSQIDTDETLQDPSAWHVVDYNLACALEPALIGIWTFEVGSDLQLVDVDGRPQIWDTPSGQEISYENLDLPPAPPA